MTLTTFYTILVIMALLAIIVFFALYFIEAGYGMFIDRKWGPAISNKVAWVVMEAPVFFVMLGFWWLSERRCAVVPVIFLIFFQTHYFRRAFIFPLKLKGKSRMPLVIMLLGVFFNLINGMIQGEWIFYLSPAEMYTPEWLTTPQFIVGTIIFFTGMAINIHSDRVKRSLRKPGDTNYYLPKGGMFRYVTSADYFGEIVEWIGFAILTWSWAGAVFALWSCANLIPRADAIYKRYKKMFGEEVGRRKRVIPFIY